MDWAARARGHMDRERGWDVCACVECAWVCACARVRDREKWTRILERRRLCLCGEDGGRRGPAQGYAHERCGWAVVRIAQGQGAQRSPVSEQQQRVLGVLGGELPRLWARRSKLIGGEL